jgi:hypothetical protein
LGKKENHNKMEQELISSKEKIGELLNELAENKNIINQLQGNNILNNNNTNREKKAGKFKV